MKIWNVTLKTLQFGPLSSVASFVTDLWGEYFADTTTNFHSNKIRHQMKPSASRGQRVDNFATNVHS